MSWLLRRAMDAPVSHCVISFRDETLGRIMVLDVQGRGFVAVPWDRWLKKNRLVVRYRLDAPSERVRDALGKLAGRLGDPYDTWSLPGYLLRRWSPRRRNPLDSGSRLVCSEAVALFLGWTGIEQLGHAGSVTPRDLLVVAEGTPESFHRQWSSRAFDRLRAELAARRDPR